MKTTRIPACKALAAALLLLPLCAAAQEADVPESTIRGGGNTVLGVGGQVGAKDPEPTANPTKKTPQVGDYFNIWDYFSKCDFSDIGAESLWKYPSESWPNGVAFIPPKGACRTEEVKDEEGNSYEPERFNLVLYKVAGIRMCKDYFCQMHLDFEDDGWACGPLPCATTRGEHCTWHVNQKTWEKGFGKGQTFMVNLVLKDGRMLIWHLKEPTARNGYKWHDLKHETPPLCLRPKY